MSQSENQLPRAMSLEHYKPLSLETCRGEAPAYIANMLAPGVVFRRRRCLDCGAEFDTQEQLMGTDARVVQRGLDALIGTSHSQYPDEALHAVRTLAAMRTTLERALELVQRAARPGRPV